MEEKFGKLTLSESNESRIFKSIISTSTSNEGEVTIQFSPSYKDVKEEILENKIGELTLSESNEGRISVTTPTTSASNLEEVPIEFSPFYEHFTEKEILENMIHVHEHYFQWKCVKGRIEIFEKFFQKNKSVTFDRSSNKQNWTNETHIDLTGLSSVHRILVIRDITEHFRKLNASRDEANKMLTESVKTTIKFILEDITFSLMLNPTVNQPGNAFFTMARFVWKGKHSDVEDFECFKNLDPKDIESIVRTARKTGKQITDSNIKNSKRDTDRKKMAEEMNFFMLLYDFEVARRLQRPFTKESRNLDSLPIGIGIAMIHSINGTENQENEGKKEKKWMFFSGLLQKDCESRILVLQEIFVAFKKCNEQRKSWTEGDWIDILCEQFDQ
ncbi:Uncharacterized protein APZ42_022834 [Daphnia magna]|uniref:Uncharacterized protein n=1 Tax=Daphnia magna TaxID=35525 RepID=A0A0P5ZEZ1_9CRUS|nr:Uncharacterized protein APZ42_022834 [Daphnia magna]